MTATDPVKTQLAAVRRHAAAGDGAALAAALRHRYQPVAEAAAAALGESRDPRAADWLVEAYSAWEKRGDPACRFRTAAVGALGKLGAVAVADLVRQAARVVQVETVGFGREDTGTRLRAAAADVLGHLRPPGAALDLAILLFDWAPNAPSGEPPVYAKALVRARAARALGDLGDPAGALPLAVKLAHPGEELPDVLVECMDSLVALAESRLPELLAPYLAHADPFLVAAAATALARGAGAGALPLLREAAGRAPAGARAPVVLALASIRSPDTPGVLLDLCRHPDPEVRLGAAEGLGVFPGDQVRAELRRLADADPDSRVREAARLSGER